MSTGSPRSPVFLDQVYSANYNGGDIKEVLTAAVHNVQNLAVDWINFKLYVLDAAVERIDMCEFDGGNRVTLVAENLQSPHGLVLDPTVGWVEIPIISSFSRNVGLFISRAKNEIHWS